MHLSSDHMRREASRVFEGDLMIWANPRDVKLYARSSYYYNDMFPDIILIL